METIGILCCNQWPTECRFIQKEPDIFSRNAFTATPRSYDGKTFQAKKDKTV
jgi:hypothetical protein